MNTSRNLICTKGDGFDLSDPASSIATYEIAKALLENRVQYYREKNDLIWCLSHKQQM